MDVVIVVIVIEIRGDSNMRVEHTFNPIYNKESKILILGSVPSVKSREKNFYYGHPKNRFWSLIAKIYNKEIPITISEKESLILNNNLAIYDVIKSCDIEGSSDSSIKNVEINDINYIIQNSKINKVIFNGSKAYKLYKKYEKDKFENLILLPSTSPANAKYSLEKLYDIWSKELVL